MTEALVFPVKPEEKFVYIPEQEDEDGSWSWFNSAPLLGGLEILSNQVKEVMGGLVQFVAAQFDAVLSDWFETPDENRARMSWEREQDDWNKMEVLGGLVGEQQKMSLLFTGFGFPGQELVEEDVVLD